MRAFFVSEVCVMSSEQILYFFLGGISCGITSFLVSTFFKRPENFVRRVEYGAISGIGAVAICWLGYRYFPSRFEAIDAIPYGIMIGLFGIGRVLDWIAKKYGLETGGDKK